MNNKKNSCFGVGQQQLTGAQARFLTRFLTFFEQSCVSENRGCELGDLSCVIG